MNIDNVTFEEAIVILINAKRRNLDVTLYLNDIELSTSDIINISNVEIAAIELKKAYFRKSTFTLIETSNDDNNASVEPLKLNACSL